LLQLDWLMLPPKRVPQLKYKVRTAAAVSQTVDQEIFLATCLDPQL